MNKFFFFGKFLFERVWIFIFFFMMMVVGEEWRNLEKKNIHRYCSLNFFPIFARPWDCLFYLVRSMRDFFFLWLKGDLKFRQIAFLLSRIKTNL